MSEVEDPVVKAVAGLMTAHPTTQQAVSALTKGLSSTNKAVASTNRAVTQLQASVTALQESVETLEASAVDIEASLEKEGELIRSLLGAVSAMAHHSN